MNKTFTSDKDYAIRLDQSDSLSGFRQRFSLPKTGIYMDGNSLGPASKEAEASLLRVMQEWKESGIGGWLDAQRPWFHFAEDLGAMAAPLVGAAEGELIMSGATTINIHALISGFYKPQGKRSKILADALNFPSDIYALKSQIQLKGLDPDKELVLVSSKNGKTLDEEAIVKRMGPETALVFLPSVLYASGQLLDMEYLSKEAGKRGIPIGFDCSHSAGAIPHKLNEWGTDFATFCSYKYMNGGPGAPAFLYINNRHFGKGPAMAGWFGYQKDKQFDMSLHFAPAPHAGGWQISTPSLLAAAALEGSLAIMNEAGIAAIREKSLRMTDYLIELIKHNLPKDSFGFDIATPLEHNRRGGHVALTHPEEAWRISLALKQRGIIPDFRQPDIIRLAPVALYNTYQEIWELVDALRKIAENREYENFPSSRHAVP